jgi:hypothetical protein
MFNAVVAENLAVYEILLKNIVEPDRPKTTIGRMHIARWIPTTTNTLTMCSIYWFSTATMVAGRRISVSL